MADSNQDPPFGAAFTNGWPQSAIDMAAAVERAWRGLLPGAQPTGGAEPTISDAPEMLSVAGFSLVNQLGHEPVRTKVGSRFLGWPLEHAPHHVGASGRRIGCTQCCVPFRQCADGLDGSPDCPKRNGLVGLPGVS